MKIFLYMSSKSREQVMGEAIVRGIERHGDTVTKRLRKDFWTDDVSDADVIAFVGVKSRRMWNACAEKNKEALIIDKGYFGRGDYYRMSIGGFQPYYLDRIGALPDRMVNKLHVQIKPKRQMPGKFILFAGSSNKYHMFHGLEEVNDYAVNICKYIQDVQAALIKQGFMQTPLPVYYRPKPSWWANPDPGEKRIVPEGTRLSGPAESFPQLLRDCHLLVTHGSNAAIEALAAGVPVFVMSEESPAYNMSEKQWHHINAPYFPDDAELKQTLANLAWCQFSLDEIASGLAWANLRKWSRHAIS